VQSDAGHPGKQGVVLMVFPRLPLDTGIRFLYLSGILWKFFSKCSFWYTYFSNKNEILIKNLCYVPEFVHMYFFLHECMSNSCQMVCFKPKIQIWVNFGGSCNGRCRYILWTLGHFRSFCYILWTVGIVCGNLVFFPFWYFVPRKIWQP
jgi:hypothetical protein